MSLQPLLYPLVDAGALIGVKRSTVYDLAARGEIETVKIGRRRLVTADSLERYVNSLRATAEGDQS